MSDARAISQRDLDQRVNAYREAEANLQAAAGGAADGASSTSATPRCARRSPGRVGQLEITVGNLVAAGPGAPVLTTLVSVNPIYASFDADEQVVAAGAAVARRDGIGARPDRSASRCEMATGASDGTPSRASCSSSTTRSMPRSGTVRVRAVFDNTDGRLIPASSRGCAWARPKPKPALLINERAVGTDQNKKFVMVVGDDNKAAYREVTLGALGRTACASSPAA